MSEKRIKFDVVKFITTIRKNSKEGVKTSIGGIVLAGVTATTVLYSNGAVDLQNPSESVKVISDYTNEIISVVGPIVYYLIFHGKK
jgi:hypothetical protein